MTLALNDRKKPKQVIMIFNQDMGMEFGIEKYAKLIKNKKANELIELSNQRKLTVLQWQVQLDLSTRLTIRDTQLEEEEFPWING